MQLHLVGRRQPTDAACQFDARAPMTLAKKRLQDFHSPQPFEKNGCGGPRSMFAAPSSVRYRAPPVALRRIGTTLLVSALSASR